MKIERKWAMPNRMKKIDHGIFLFYHIWSISATLILLALTIGISVHGELTFSDIAGIGGPSWAKETHLEVLMLVGVMIIQVKYINQIRKNKKMIIHTYKESKEIQQLRKELDTWKEVAQSRESYINSLNEQITRLQEENKESE